VQFELFVYEFPLFYQFGAFGDEVPFKVDSKFAKN